MQQTTQPTSPQPSWARVRRIMGLTIIAVGLLGLIISVTGAIYTWQLIGVTGRSLITTLDIAGESLDTVADTLRLTKTAVTQMESSVATVQTTAANVSSTISETRPLMDQITTVISEDVPGTLNALQNTMPSLTQTAGVIDNTLRTLSAFGIDRNLGLFNLNFDLGIDYDPEVPFGESVADLGESLEGLPEHLEMLDESISNTADNLQIIGGNMGELAANLDEINRTVADINPLLDEYIVTVHELQDQVVTMRRNLQGQLRAMQVGSLLLFAWLGLSQIAPLYVGYELFRSGRRYEQVAMELEATA